MDIHFTRLEAVQECISFFLVVYQDPSPFQKNSISMSALLGSRRQAWIERWDNNVLPSLDLVPQFSHLRLMADVHRCPVHCLSPIHLLMEHLQREQCNRTDKCKPLSLIHVTSFSIWICIGYRGRLWDKRGSSMVVMNTIKELHMVASTNQELHSHWPRV